MAVSRHAAAAMYACLIAFSRIYLGAHWFSDVAGGLAFAVAWLALLTIAYLNHQTAENEPRGLLPVVIAIVIAAGGFNIYRHHGTDMERYAVQARERRVLAADWWKSDWQTLPAYRVDFDGEAKEPITFQWAGSLADLETTLRQKDWRAVTPWTLTGALAWFTSHPDPMNLPTLPYLERGRLPSLTLVHSGENPTSSRFTLRMWATDIDLQNGHSTELWIGSVVEEDLVNRLSLLTLPQDQPSADIPRDLLAASIEAARLTTRAERQVSGQWDGRVLLAHNGKVTVN